MDIFDLAAKITLNSDGYTEGLDRAEGQFKAFGSKLGTAIKNFTKATAAAVSAATAAGAAATVKIVKDAVANYADYEQLVGGVETLFKESAEQVQKYADAAYRTAGLSANEYMETVTSFSASLLQSLGGDTERAAEYADMAIRDMSDNANKMGTDMSAIQNAYQGFAKQNYTMLDNLKLGYGGTKTEMERLIKDAEKLNKNFKATRDENGDLAMSYSDIVDAIHIVQDEMGITGTTAKEASTTIQGSVASMKAAWQNLLTGLVNSEADFDGLVSNFVEATKTAAANIIPAVQSGLNGVSKLIEGLAPIIAEELPELIKGAVPGLLSAATSIVKAFGGALLEGLPTLIKTAADIVKSFISGIRTKIPDILQAVGDIIELVISELAAVLPELFNIGAEILTTIIDGISNNIDGIAKTVIEIVQKIATTITTNAPKILKAGVELIKNLAKGIIDALPQLISAIPVLFEGILSAITESLPDVIEAAVQIVETLIDGLVSNIPQLIDTVISIALALVDALTDPDVIVALTEGAVNLIVALASGLIEAIPKLLEKVPEIILALCTALVNSTGSLIEAGVKLVDKLWEGIKSCFKDIAEWGSKIIEAIKDGTLWDKMKQWGKDAINKIWEGITSLWDNIKGWASKIFEVFKSGTVWKDIQEYGPEIIDKIWQGIQSTWETIKTWAKSIFDTIVEGASTVWTTIIDIGKGIVEGIWQGISEAASWLYDKISGWVDDVLGWFGDLLGISSPSKKFAELGDYSAQGYVNGLNDGLNNGKAGISKSVKDLLNAVTDQASNLKADGKNAGNSYGDGLAEGLNAKYDRIYQVASSVARAANRAVKATLQIASPSKIARHFGAYFSEGLALGIEDEIDSVESAATKASKAAIDALEQPYDIEAEGALTTGGSSPIVSELLSAINQLKETFSVTLVLDDGTIVGHIDNELGYMRARKARGN